MKAKKDYAGIAAKYCKDIVSGKIPAGRYTMLACQRHLDDLKKQKDDNYPFYFEPEKAWRVCNFVESLKHVKGEWKGQNIALQPWQVFIFSCSFGWLKKKDGYRRFRESYNEIARKNGKSVLAAGAGLYCFAGDDENGAEVYSGATSEKQAWEVFKPAMLMVKWNPMLKNHFGIDCMAKNMNIPADASKFEPLIGNPGDGASPSCAIVDEYHEHQDDDLYMTMLTGMGARTQPMMWVITTAGYDISSPCYEKRQEVIDTLEGTIDNPRLFGIIYAPDEGDEWTSEIALRKANPNMGVSVFEEYLYDQIQLAVNVPRQTNKIKTKHLNIWTSSKSAFFNMESWKKCEDQSLRQRDFSGWDCYMGLDLARKLDLNAGPKLFTEIIDGKRHYYCVSPLFWCPEDTIYDNDNKKYAERLQGWLNADVLTETDGAEIDYRYILNDVIKTNMDYPIKGLGIDPSGATSLSHQLADEGIESIDIPQNFTQLSDPMKELEAAIEAGRFHHDGNPLLSWNISNVVGKHIPGNDDVVRPIKEGYDNKIDGAVALIMAVKMAMDAGNKPRSLADLINSRGTRRL